MPAFEVWSDPLEKGSYCGGMSTRIIGTLLSLAVALPCSAQQSSPRPRVDLVDPGGTHHGVVDLQPLRSPYLEVRAWRGGRMVSVDPAPPRVLRGRLVEDPGSCVLLWLRRDGQTLARVFPSQGPPWSVGVTEEFPSAELTCGTCTAPELYGPGAGPPLLDPIAPGGCMTRCEIAFDADNAYYLAVGGTTTAVVDRIEWMMAVIDHIYARDALITYDVTTIVVREELYYTSDGDNGAILGDFIDEWNTNLADVPRDIAHLMTERSTPGIGGVAYLGVVCTSLGYALSHDSEYIVAHEIGHNWNAGHCHDPWTRNILCNSGGLFIGPNTRDVITAHKLSRSCLDDVGLYPAPLTPYAVGEEVAVTASEIAAGTPLTIDVLANDHDGNCDRLELAGFDATSARGGSVALSVGTGPDGRDELTYTPPAEDFIGLDSFSYTIVDRSGTTAGADVVLDVSSPGVKGYWTFDETSGSTAADSSGFGHDAVAQAPAQWVPGVIGGALEFDGADQVLDTLAPSFEPPWSVSAWVRRATGAGSSAHLIESDDGSLRLEQWYNTGRVGVTRYGAADSNFGVSVPVGAWSHLTFVGTKDDTSLFVDGQAAGSVPTSIRAPMGPISDEDGPLVAAVDDLRVYNVALGPEDVEDLHHFGGGAVAPRPIDGGSLSDTGSEPLRWSGGFGVTSYEVYLGTDAEAVGEASLGSPEYRGSQTATEYLPSGLVAGTTYYWRVDALAWPTAVAGAVWRFRLAPEGLLAHWPMDEGTGTIAIDATGQHDALLVGGTGWVPGQSGTGLRFYGNEELAVSSLPEFDPPWTIALWVKRKPSPTSSAVLMRSSDAGLKLDQWPSTKKVGLTVWGVVDATFDVQAPLQTWMHLAFVGSSTEVHLYADGLYADSVPHAIRAPTGSIGGLGDPLNAVVDDVRVYDRALTASEIFDLAQ